MTIELKNVTKAESLKPTKSWTGWVGEGLETVFAILLCGLSLLTFKVISVFVSLVERGLDMTGIARPVRSRPVLATSVGCVTALFAALPASATLLLAYGGWPLRDGAFLTGLALIVGCGPHALASASRLKGLGDEGPVDSMERWFSPRMRHPADAVWPSVVTIISLLVLPATAGLAIPGAFGARTVALYGAVVWVTWKSATDFEHADSHYHFFRRYRATGRLEKFVFRSLDIYLTYVFTILLARVPHWYEVQHVVIHHSENNGFADTQSTLKYDRASFIDFAKCANRFAVSGLLSIDVIVYLIKKRRLRALRRLATGICLFYGTLAAVCTFDWQIATTILFVRYVGGIISSMGFFQEHGIVDISDPDNIYRNSLHYIALDNTHGSRGEDFHIEHHLHPGRHWAEYGGNVSDNLTRYAAERAIGFLDGPGRIDMYYRMLWRGDFTSLAPYFIVFGQPGISSEEMAGLLRARTRPLGAAEDIQTSKTMDRWLGRRASYLLG